MNTDDRDILARAVEAALIAWEEATRDASLLGRGQPDKSILEPLSSAISSCCVYQAVAGHVLFTANSGPVLDAPGLAIPLLNHAESARWRGKDVGNAARNAADWLLKMLTTREAAGTFTGAIWGLRIDEQVFLTENSWLVPFTDLPDSRFKKLITDRARPFWNNAVWMSQRDFDAPGAAFVRKAADFPYIRTDDASLKTMIALEAEAYNFLIYLQGKAAGQPLTLGYWFTYDDEELDLNSFDNFVSWILPEITPVIRDNVPMDGRTIQQEVKALLAMPEDWRNDLHRSMERYVLSRCRHQLIDHILDLTLAFEIAVSGKSEQVPQSWKVSVRTAQMIGGPISKKQENRRKLTALYNLRNRGTHGSDLTRDRDKQEAVLANALPLYRSLLDSFWQHKVRPDWDAIELGQ